MNGEYKRQTRINDLYKKAVSKKYTWKQLEQLAKATGVSQSTAKSYLIAVECMLIKSGQLRKKNS